MPFFQLSGALLARSDFLNITFDFVLIFPIYVKKIHEIKTSVKKIFEGEGDFHIFWSNKMSCTRAV